MISRLALMMGWLLLLMEAATACDLCAISSASSARGDSASGFLFTLSEQFVPYRQEYIDGEEFNRRVGHPDWLDKSITHLVPTYNFSERVGVSLNVPVIHESFRRLTIRYGAFGQRAEIEQGTETGLGDMSLVGRVTLFNKSEMTWGVGINALLGVKFPTGDTERLEDEVEQYNQPGHPHTTTVSGVHQSHLTLGSGSFDGVFGINFNARWQRFFLSVLTQYYLRTEGVDGYTYGSEVMVNGGPGCYVLLDKSYTLAVQAYAGYESMARDDINGDKIDYTGMTAWYLGPQVSFTWGQHFSAQAAVDVPLSIENNGWQNAPSYRIHGGLTWRF